nr:hypothetical protein [Pandoravirus massiliensis]
MSCHWDKVAPCLFNAFLRLSLSLFFFDNTGPPSQFFARHFFAVVFFLGGATGVPQRAIGRAKSTAQKRDNMKNTHKMWCASFFRPRWSPLSMRGDARYAQTFF